MHKNENLQRNNYEIIFVGNMHYPELILDFIFIFFSLNPVCDLKI